MKKIIILQPGLDQSLAIAKYLKKHSQEYRVIGGLLRGEKAFKSQYYDGFEEVNQENGVGEALVLPTGAKSTSGFFSGTDQLKVGSISYNSANLIVFDKLKTLEIVKELGIPIPETSTSVKEISQFPVFYKELHEVGGGVRGLARARQDLVPLVNSNHPLCYQEYIDSPHTFGVAFLARDGKIITHFIQKELVSLPKVGGSGVVLEKISDTRLLEYTGRILDRLSYSGWGLAEFKYCPKRKDYVFMEVNAKLWASIEFMLLNNSTFLAELFDVQYESGDVGGVIFMDRLAEYGLPEYLKYLISGSAYHKLNYKRSMYILMTLPTRALSLSLRRLASSIGAKRAGSSRPLGRG